MSSHDPLYQLKRTILTRLNKEYKYVNNTLVKLKKPIESSNSLKSLQETRNEYIEKLQQRVKELEQKSVEKPRVASPVNETFKSIFGGIFGKTKDPISNTTELPIKPLTKNTNLEPERDPTMKLKACVNCGRKFRIERLETHQNACLKSKSARTRFDGEKMRLKGTELESFKKENQKQSEPKYFRDQRAKTAKAGIRVSKQNPMVPKVERDDLFECAHCGRYFAEGSLEKHQDICEKIKQKPPRAVFRTKPVLSIR